ncbi:MAG: diguanylate cyclase [Spirochaetales bacterium]|nr:diguanylate cyclase [Spirochaetales bacterium]
MPFVFALFSFLISYYYLNLGINVLKRGKKSFLKFIFFLCCFCYTVWSFFYTFIYYSNDSNASLIMIRYSVLAWAFLPSLSALFVMFFIAKRKIVLKAIVFVFMMAISIGFVVASLSGNLMAIFIKRTPYGWIEYADLNKSYSLLFTLYTSICFIFSVIGLFILRLKAKSFKEKKQSSLILFGIALTFLVTIVAEIFLPIIGVNWIPSFGHFYGIFFAVSVEVALLNYNLLQNTSEIVLENILPHIRDLVILVDLEGHIEDSNLDSTFFKDDPQRARRIQDLDELFIDGQAFRDNFYQEYLSGKRHLEMHDVQMSFYDDRKFPADIYFTVLSDRFGDDIGFLLVIKNISEMKNLHQITDKLQDSNKKLIHLAETDALTQVKNRKKMEDILDLEMIVAMKYRTPLSIIMFDLDNFKEINDNFGHDVGDQVLVLVCNEVQSLIRSSDVLGRWGGEEFLVVCRNTDIESVSLLAERIRLGIMELSKQGVVDFISASFGVAEFSSEESKNKLLIRLDKAMYSSKHQGKNCVSKAQ